MDNKGFTRGFQGFGNALRFMLRNRMAWMFLVPMFLWALFAVGLFKVGDGLTDTVQAWGAGHLGLSVPTTDRAGLAGAWDDVKAFLNGAREVILWIVLKLAVFWLVGLVGKYVVLVLLSPLLSYASERAEELITGTSTPFSLVRWLKEVMRGILMALRNGAVELGFNVVVWTATLFMPLLAPISAIILWLVSCWFYGFSMFDYVHERRGWGLRTSLRTAREKRGMVLANGIFFNLLMKIPFVGMITAPLLGAVGAVIAFNRGERTLPAGHP